MNAPLFMVLVLLVVISLGYGMIWFALAIGFIAVIASLIEKKPETVSPRPKFVYGTADRGPIPPLGDKNKGQQDLRIYFAGDWDGNEDDLVYHDAIAESWGNGLGRGLGFLR